MSDMKTSRKWNRNYARNLAIEAGVTINHAIEALDDTWRMLQTDIGDYDLYQQALIRAQDYKESRGGRR